MEERAFVLRESAAEGFAGGSIAAGPMGRTLDYGSPIIEHGVYVTSDADEIRALRAVEVLKEVSPDSKTAQEAEPVAVTSDGAVPGAEPPAIRDAVAAAEAEEKRSSGDASSASTSARNDERKAS